MFSHSNELYCPPEFLQSQRTFKIFKQVFILNHSILPEFIHLFSLFHFFFSCPYSQQTFSNQLFLSRSPEYCWVFKPHSPYLKNHRLLCIHYSKSWQLSTVSGRFLSSQPYHFCSITEVQLHSYQGLQGLDQSYFAHDYRCWHYSVMLI